MGKNLVDELTGLDIFGPNVEEKVLYACQVRLSENPRVDCLHLFFGGDDEVTVERNDTIVSLKKKLDKIRGKDTTS